MKIARIEVESFQGAPDGAYDFCRDGGVAPWTAVVGAPRAGKSSVLGAIARAKEVVGPGGVALGGPRVLRHGAVSGRVEATWLLDVAEAEAARVSDVLVATRWTFSSDRSSVDAPAGLRKLFSTFSRSDAVAKLEVIPEQLSTEAAREVPEVAALRSARGAPRAGKYTWAPAALKQALLGEAVALRGELRDKGLVLEGETTDSSARYRQAISAVAPHLSLGVVADLGAGLEPTFVAAAHPGGIGWSSLAASDRQALAIAIAGTYLGLSRSLLLWDSPDRTCGAGTHGALLRAIMTLFPDAQLVMSLDAATPTPEHAKVLALGR